MGENTKTLQKTDRNAPNTRHSKTPTTCNGTRIHTTITADLGSQETARHQANKGNAKPWQEMPQQATKNAKKHLRHANHYATCS